ncbi:maleylpyruvate isomerase N-terminal domain-containing protein [Mycobacterium avium]|uniref:maleylpyruvate isomerase N-terminal domain-containing protein n=1 Tax=Mycobacterium avium TaxID=1764 RepID=UPI0034DCCC11
MALLRQGPTRRHHLHHSPGRSHPEDLVAQFDRRIARLVDALNSLSDEAADRTVTLDGRQVSVALVARSAWHECHHHLRDIRGCSSS